VAAHAFALANTAASVDDVSAAKAHASAAAPCAVYVDVVDVADMLLLDVCINMHGQ
jgi:hypothetical protein